MTKRTRKWLILGIVGLASGVLTLLLFRSLPMASGSAALTIVAVIAAKHLALAAAAGSPPQILRRNAQNYSAPTPLICVHSNTP